ncbi:DUF1566 domain-containing protein [Photobacterium rosenbergii]|uniref:DUF1566 domain-containing protein n=1 Tax=Photobacterium rosenbergii TaxID=294936 RepID=UPI001C993554|nr:DUF1566 domain-containing protein [Photobacterium rosenbergii]MBY5948403.1 DUF1566 domain-containing protein [Photobacterium rosenbergii]
MDKFQVIASTLCLLSAVISIKANADTMKCHFSQVKHQSYQQAKTYCQKYSADINGISLSDWRLPTYHNISQYSEQDINACVDENPASLTGVYVVEEGFFYTFDFKVFDYASEFVTICVRG